MKFFAIDRNGRILGEYNSMQQLRQAMNYNRIFEYSVIDEEEYQEMMIRQQPRQDVGVPSLPQRKKSFIPNMIGKNSGKNAYRIPRFDPLRPDKYDRRDDDDE